MLDDDDDFNCTYLCCDCKLVYLLEGTLQKFFKKLKLELSYGPAILLLLGSKMSPKGYVLVPLNTAVFRDGGFGNDGIMRTLMF